MLRKSPINMPGTISLSIILFLLFFFAGFSNAANFSHTATDTPIPVNTYQYAYSTISVSDTSIITDLNVYVDLEHTWLNNLDIWIEHNGIWVQLFNNQGGDKDDIVVTFDDEAETMIGGLPSAIPPAFEGYYRPAAAQTPYTNLLSTFDGMSLEGNWTLIIYDWLLTGANGTLNTFRIEGTADPDPSSALINKFTMNEYLIGKDHKIHYGWVDGEIVKNFISPIRGKVIIRRGFPFEVTLELSPYFNPAHHQLHFQALHMFDNQTSTINIPVSNDEVPQGEWGAQLLELTEEASGTKKAHLKICTPFDAPIGEYELKATVNNQSMYEILYEKRVIILFNPWSQDDDVSMENEAERYEYVLSRIGRIWMKNLNTTMSWDYWQFDDTTVNTVLQLLNGLSSSQRANPIIVSRHLTNELMHDEEEGGVLWGKWCDSQLPNQTEADYQEYLDECYAGGKRPGYWRNSIQIFDEYIRLNRSPVKYGQCWVFAGILTSALRALGIPARSITNYESGVDYSLPPNNAIDIYYWGPNSTFINFELSDKKWNYHLWVEAYMKRPDRPGFDGWQAVDATSDLGLMKIGPAPVKAIKSDTDSETGGAFDVDFFYNAVKAVANKWIYTGSGYILEGDYPYAIGRNIVTKAVGSEEGEDIWSFYEDQQLFVNILAENLNDELSIDTYIPEDIEIGTNIVGIADVENISGDPISIKANINCSAIDYNGNVLTQLGFTENEYLINPGQHTIITLVVPEAKYTPYLRISQLFEIIIAVNILGTEEVYLKEQRVSLVVPGLDLTVSPTSTIYQKENTECNVVWTNPFSYTLNNTVLSISVSDSLTIDQNYQTDIEMGSLAPGQTINILKEIIGGKEGRGIVSSVLGSDEINNIRGELYINVMSIGDFDNDGDVDGFDLYILTLDPSRIDLFVFAGNYGL